MTWNIASAKQQFSEVVRLTAEEPQAIYNRDKPVAVLMSAQEYEEFKAWQAQKKRPTLAEQFDEIRALLAAPGLHQAARRGGFFHRQAHPQRRPRARRADGRGGGLDRGAQASPSHLRRQTECPPTKNPPCSGGFRSGMRLATASSNESFQLVGS